MSNEKKVAIFIDSRKKSGGAYQELLYTIEKIKIENKSKIKFILIATSKKFLFIRYSLDVMKKF